MILFDHIEKRYGAHTALQDFSLSIPQGQVIGLLGQNGAGKSTAMKILTGCISPTAGQVYFQGQNMASAAQDIKRQIGYLPENAPLYDEMTVQSYLVFVCRLKGLEEKKIAAHIEDIAIQTGIQSVLSRRIGNLSRGYRQRTAFAQALCANPALIVLDEPTQGLDPVQTAEFRTLIRSLGKEHTVLFSSHILPDVEQICDRAVLLHQGKIIADRMLHARSDKKLRCLIRMGEGKLLPALRTLRSAEKVEALPDHPAGQTHVLITAKENTPIEEELFTLLSSLQAPILRLTPETDSLEDLFLRATARQ